MIDLLIAAALISAETSEQALIESAPGSRVEQLEELHDQEVGVLVEVPLSFHPTEEDFLACVPQESIPFPKEVSADLKERIFTDEEMHALMDCDLKDCKFNFLPSEIPILEAAKTAPERQKLFFQFLEDRIQGKRGIDPNRSRLFLRSKDHAFEDCDGPELQRLLNERPIRDLPYRLSVVKYSKKMRPTTRLLQGQGWKTGQNYCYGEALLFSDHYDVDRVEVWSLRRTGERDLLRLQVRHRIDLLNSWFRRLNKGKFRKEAREIVSTQISQVEACLKSKRKVELSPSKEQKK